MNCSKDRPKESAFKTKIKSYKFYLGFIIKNPFLIFRLINNYFKIIVLKQKVIRAVDISITAACNAKCEHCCIDATVDMRHAEGRASRQHQKPMSIDEIKSYIEQASRLGAVVFNFLGGEPLVYKHIYEAIRCVKKNHGIAGMSTNGYLLSEEVVANLKRAGLDVIQVDLGGAINPDEIDEIRKLKGCYERAINGIALLKKAGIKVILSTIMTRKNIANGEIWQAVQLAKDLDIKINVNCSAQVGGWSMQQDSELNQEEWKVYQEIKKNSHVRWAGSTNYTSEACPCGTEKILISPYAEVQPCGLMPISYGNLNKEKLNTVWNRMMKNEIVCDGNQKKSCRAAWDKKIIEINKHIYSSEGIKPMPVEQIPKEVINGKQVQDHTQAQ